MAVTRLPRPQGRCSAGLFDGRETASLAIGAQRKYYVHLIRGELTVNGRKLQAGDAAKLQRETFIALSEGKEAEVLVFDLTP